MCNVKNNIYYYIDNLIKSTKNTNNQLYIFDIKMKLVNCNRLDQFEAYLHNKKIYVTSNKFKLDIIDDIINQIKREKQYECQHLFSHLETNICTYDIGNCPKHFINDEKMKQKWIDAQVGWSMTCVICGIKTSDIGIKLGFSTQNLYPDDNDLFRLFEMCEINRWNIK